MARKSTANKETVHELEILFPERSLEIDGRVFEIKEYSFVECLKFGHLLEPLINEVKKEYSGIPSGLEIKEILLNHFDVIRFMLPKVCNITEEELNHLAIESGEILTIVWWDVNRYSLFDLFKDKKKAAKEKGTEWIDAVTTLRGSGIPTEEIRKLTLRQFQSYLESIYRLKRHDMADEILSVSIGTNGGKDTIKTVKDLRK